MRATLLATIAVTAVACSHRTTIPGTNIPDEPETRAVLQIFVRYKHALEARDAAALLRLAAPDYSDPGDTSRGEGPTDYQTLKTKLPQTFEKLSGLKLEATVRDVEVKGQEARIDYYQVLRFAVRTPSGGENWKSASDDARMKFVNVRGEWRIASGL
jgi:hypothetical protein